PSRNVQLISTVFGTSVKEGLLLKQTSSFQRWKKRYFKLRGRTLYYAKDAKSLIFDEVDLSDASVAESSTKNVNNSFTVITPFRRLILCAENRKEMEDWISSLKSVQSREHYETAQFNVEHFSGMHNWYACSHARPTFCNVCRDSLSGVTSHGLSCEVCKFKAHKRCAVRATNNCKWTTLASIGKDIIEDEDGIAMPHQWLEGNLPVSAKCAVCDKTCGSVLRLQDWRCLWCKAMVHTACMDLYPRKCPLGQCKVSIIPPTALNSIDSDGFWKATCPPSCASPLLVFVNSKSGDNQGVKFLRRFKQLLNPAQVFDLVNGGPHLGLRLFQKFDNFRILVCGGDGSVMYYNGDLVFMLRKCYILSSCYCSLCCISGYEDSVAAHLTKILNSDKHSVVISSSNTLSFVLCPQCAILNEKLDSLLQTLNLEAQAMTPSALTTPPIVEEEVEEEELEEEEDLSEESLTELKENETEKGSAHKLFRPREQLVLRANSLKKALRQIIEQAERMVDEQNAHTEEQELQSPTDFRKDSEEENRDNEKDEDTKELEALPCEFTLLKRRHIVCDGQYIPLPSLQGIAVLNIPSYAGGTNFWGGTKEDDIFCAPSFDDKILEVVAVFGSMQMAVSRVIKLQHHRIAQCRTVKITILGDEGVPVQVDGEAWIQPPGVIKIQHKNRAQMLTRDRAFENTLKSWEDKLKYDKPPLRPPLYPQHSVDLATEEEATLIQMCARAAEDLITRICEAAKNYQLLEQELAHAVNASSHAINKTHPKFPESLTRNTAIEVASTVKALHNETESLLVGRVPLQLDPPHEELLSSALQSVEVELGKLAEIPWLYHILQPNDEEYGKRNSRSGMFRIVPKFKKEKAPKKSSPQSGKCVCVCVCVCVCPHILEYPHKRWTLKSWMPHALLHS
uniref:Diacylglycerol kinase n=1 Tax=Sinocyclocheilus grahami TaxID=75366 RepID=A0A672L9B7_SINGR